MRELERWHTFLRARFKLASCFHPFQRLFIFLFVQRTVLFDVTVVVISFFFTSFLCFPHFSVSFCFSSFGWLSPQFPAVAHGHKISSIALFRYTRALARLSRNAVLFSLLPVGAEFLFVKHDSAVPRANLVGFNKRHVAHR